MNPTHSVSGMQRLWSRVTVRLLPISKSYWRCSSLMVRPRRDGRRSLQKLASAPLSLHNASSLQADHTIRWLNHWRETGEASSKQQGRGHYSIWWCPSSTLTVSKLLAAMLTKVVVVLKVSKVRISTSKLTWVISFLLLLTPALPLMVASKHVIPQGICRWQSTCKRRDAGPQWTTRGKPSVISLPSR